MVAGSRLNSKWTEISKEKMRKPKTEEHKEHLKIAIINLTSAPITAFIGICKGIGF